METEYKDFVLSTEPIVTTYFAANKLTERDRQQLLANGWTYIQKGSFDESGDPREITFILELPFYTDEPFDAPFASFLRACDAHGVNQIEIAWEYLDD